MGEVEPRWYYVGNGQLRCKDANGWTDQYQDIDGPKRVAEVETPEVIEAARPSAGRRAGESAPSAFSKVRSSAAHSVTVGLTHAMAGLRHEIDQGYRRVSASLASRSGTPQPSGAASQSVASHQSVAPPQSTASRQSVAPPQSTPSAKSVAPPQPGPPASGAPVGRLRGHRKDSWRDHPGRLVGMGAALLVAFGVGAGYSALPGASFTTHGTLTLAPSSHGTGNLRCTGRSGFHDLTAGTQVTISDASHKTLVLGRLDQGRYVPGKSSGNGSGNGSGKGTPSVGACVFRFTVNNTPAGEDFYGVTVGSRSGPQFTNAQMQAGPLLKMGDPKSKALAAS